MLAVDLEATFATNTAHKRRVGSWLFTDREERLLDKIGIIAHGRTFPSAEEADEFAGLHHRAQRSPVFTDGDPRYLLDGTLGQQSAADRLRVLRRIIADRNVVQARAEALPDALSPWEMRLLLTPHRPSRLDEWLHRRGDWMCPGFDRPLFFSPAFAAPERTAALSAARGARAKLDRPAPRHASLFDVHEHHAGRL